MRNITLDFKTYFLLSYYFSTIDKTNIKNTENIHSIRQIGNFLIVHVANFINIIIIKGNCFITIM